MDFQFKLLPIDIIHRNRISSSRKKLGKTKSINFSFNFVLSLNRLCPKSAPEHIIIRQSSPGAHHFCYFCGKYCPGFLSAQDPHYFYYFCQKIMPRTTLYLAETVPAPLFLSFIDKIICPGLPRTMSEASSPS